MPLPSFCWASHPPNRHAFFFLLCYVDCLLPRLGYFNLILFYCCVLATAYCNFATIKDNKLFYLVTNCFIWYTPDTTWLTSDVPSALSSGKQRSLLSDETDEMYYEKALRIEELAINLVEGASNDDFSSAAQMSLFNFITVNLKL